MSTGNLILVGAVGVVFLLLLLGVVSVAWPFILVALGVWMLARAVR